MDRTIAELQELIMAVMPHWHCRIAKPLRRLLDEGITPEMFFCLQRLRIRGNGMAMSELAQAVRSPKQQMTKVVDKLIEKGFAERVSDPCDRRIVRLILTDRGLAYIEQFLQQDAAYYRSLFDAMSPEDREDFGEALETIFRVLSSLPCHSPQKGSTV